MHNRSIKLISKYSLLLIVFYAVEILFGYSVDFLVKDIGESEVSIIIIGIPYFIMYLLNIITAYVIYQDRNRFKIEEKYSVLLTVFYRPIGIVLFLIYQINNEINEKPAHNTGS